ncbi:hypothetical protein B0H19DRAFT_1098527 [Mycena capillaripes]|nr:hypothetical protein B0H19DRAFT_1098527 [Mycena capillaripes]
MFFFCVWSRLYHCQTLSTVSDVTFFCALLSGAGCRLAWTGRRVSESFFARLAGASAPCSILSSLCRTVRISYILVAFMCLRFQCFSRRAHSLRLSPPSFGPSTLLPVAHLTTHNPVACASPHLSALRILLSIDITIHSSRSL